MAKNAAGETPLHLAGKNGHTDTAQVLLEMGANVYDKTKDGWTPLVSRCF
jgi:ankyrin repeat protein